MKKNMWKRVAAVGITFGMLITCMPVQAFDDEMIVEDDSYFVVEDEIEETIDSENDGDDYGIDFIDQSIISDDEETILDNVTDETEAELYVAEDGSIPIDKAHFPDDNFRAIICETSYDSDGNGVLSANEIADITTLDAVSSQISSFDGIEYFTNLIYLYCSGNKLTSLNVSKNTALEKLVCSSNRLTSLDVSKSVALKYLDCSYNQLTSLDMNNNTSLETLQCEYNKLMNLNISKCTALLNLFCTSNQLTNLDVNQNISLDILYCSGNKLTSLNVSKNLALKYLECTFNELTSLDMSKNTALEKLVCSSNRLTSLDVSKSVALKYLDCSYNQLTSLDMRNNTSLETLQCDNNELTNLNISKCMALLDLDCGGNQLTNLDLIQNISLEYLRCHTNQLTSLNVSNNTALSYLDCCKNQLKNLDVSKNTVLVNFTCFSNQLTSLDVSKNTKLFNLVCSDNQLARLDLSKNTDLEDLECEDNQLTSLDISACPFLKYAYHNGDCIIDGGIVSHAFSGITEEGRDASFYLSYDSFAALIVSGEGAPVTEYTGSLKWDNDRTITGVQYKDIYFKNSSFNYNHALARISLGLAMTGFNRPKGNYYSKQPVALTDQEKKLSKAGNAVELLENCGFNVSSMRVNSGYLSKPGANTIGDLMAVKDIGDDTKLIAIVVRGGGYESEWAGNFNVYNPGSGTEHVGFEMAFDQVREDFHDYLAENNITGKVKIWITGYSRGAAVANLTAAYLNELSQIIGSIQFSNSDVYAYTFETPQNTKSTHVSDAFHRNIFNIINPIDLVPKVAFSKWGYSRYGTTYYLPSSETTTGYESLTLEALNYYNALTGKSHLYLPHVAGQIELLDGLFDGIASLSKSDSSDATMKISNGLQNLMLSLNSSSDDSYLTKALSYFLGCLPLRNSRKVTKYMIELIIQAHYPELTYAWMQTVNGGMCSIGRYEYRLIKVNCPVDVHVYDNGGNLVASVENDEVQDIGSNALSAFIDDDGQKTVCIPSDSHYEVVMTATDDGSMTYSISDVINEEEVRRTSYFDIPINNGDTFVANTYSSVSGENSSGLSSSDGAELSPDEVLTDSFDQYYSVQVTTNGGGAVSGAGTKKKGDYIRVIATPETHSQFMGWYIGEKLVSEEMTYRFRVESDTVINGRFLKGNHDFGSWKVTKAATESSTGIQTRTCSSCGYKESKTIPKSQPKITITKKPTIQKPTPAKGKITVKWKHFKHTSKKTKAIWKKIKKVQVQCATDSGFKNIVKDVKIGRGKTKYAIKGLNKKTTYYVRVRYYDGTGYSAWSKVKKVKTK